jgi:hypothetical protein
VDFAGAKPFEPFDLGSLIIGIEIKMDARRKHPRRGNFIERNVGTNPILGFEQNEIVCAGFAYLVVECISPKTGLGF